MNRQDIIAMAIQADLVPDALWETPELEQFAALVAAKEREECAKVADKFAESSQYKTQRNLAEWCASSIRARGQL